MADIPYPDLVHVSSAADFGDAVEVLELGDNYQQTVETGLNPVFERWALTWNALDDDQIQAALGVLNAARCITAMTWTSPIDGVQRKYKAVPNTRKVDKSQGLWRLSVTVRQVFEP
ncbi:phage tail protein [Methylomonas sp. CM2]|uniref:phage tail protein n=1 Tax=Methylomonas sp. CM2 TaxID=3417647 RepID=UPI003CEF8C1F